MSDIRSLCAELSFHMYVALDVGYLDQPRFEELNARAKEVGRIIAGLRASVRIDGPQ